MKHAGLFAFLIALASPSAGRAADWSATLGSELSSGKFGADQSTQIFIATADVTASFSKWQVRASLPYVQVDGPSTFLGPISAEDLGADFDTRDDFITAFTDDGNVDGIGDLRVSASRFFFLPFDGTILDLSLSIKVPTGDPDKLLSTGQVDVEFGGDLVKRFGDTSVSLGASYTVSGKTDRFDVQNRARTSLGVYHEINDGLGLGAVGEWRQAVIEDLPDVMEASVYFSARITDQFSLLGYVLTGFSDTAPDVGGGFRLTRDF